MIRTTVAGVDIFFLLLRQAFFSSGIPQVVFLCFEKHMKTLLIVFLITGCAYHDSKDMQITIP